MPQKSTLPPAPRTSVRRFTSLIARSCAAQAGARARDRQGHPKKSGGLLREGERVRFTFIRAERAEPAPIGTVSELCRALDVSRSGFYAFVRRPESARTREDRLLEVKVAEAHARSHARYGSPRVHRELKKQKFAVSRKRVIRLMRKQGLVGRTRKKFVVTTDSNHQLETAPNLLDRNFEATAPDQKWVGDITYLKTPEGWLYLAVIIDLFSRFVVGWALSPKIDRHLVMKALTMATKRRGQVAGRLFHSDRGSQYASEEHRTALVDGGFTCSMSRRGNCLDNAVSESWFSTLKTELGAHFASHDDAEVQLFEFIEVFYNQQRSHSTLDYVSPAEFERAHAQAVA
ncbi:MAG: IS3 family transposase [Archangium sp.]|nr:IS3 family transposase [Archangium sp.]